MSAVELQPVDNEATKRKWSPRFAACACVVVLALYALSPLPVHFLVEHLPYEFADSLMLGIELLYSPLSWMYDEFSVVEDFYDWYFGFLE